MRTNETETELRAGDIRKLPTEEVEFVSGARNSFWPAVMDGFVNACTEYCGPRSGPYFVSCSGDLKPLRENPGPAEAGTGARLRARSDRHQR